ncbi:MAG TPA: BamA/TamA family outer membrane protein [Bryobacteraceae bacterium]|nr:BamA/TamA family outer membrane protein [Bryobacteraceae bacterium]
MRPVSLGLTVTAWVLFLSPGAIAQVDGVIGKRIVDIQFTPAQILDPADLAIAVPMKKGDPLRTEDVAAALDALFATGRFEDLVVEAEPSGDGVVVRFVTKNTWFVGGVSVDGKVAIPPSRGQLGSAAQLRLGAPFQEEDVTKAVDSMKHLLDSNGLYEAEIKPSVERDDKFQHVFISFTVKQGKRAKYEKPVVEGACGLSDGTILRATGWRIPIIHRWRRVTDSLTRKGVQGLLGKYQKDDRLKATVELKKLDYDASRRRVRPNLSVDPGPKVEIKAVEANVSKRTLKRYVPVYQERAVDNDLLVEGRRNLSEYFQSKGYYDVDVDFRVLPAQADHETIEYVISQGPRSKIVHLAISGNKYFTEDTIRERMFMEPATFNLRRGRYSEAFRRKDEENIINLYKSNGFRDVKVTTLVDRSYKGRAGRMAVTVSIEEGPQWLVEQLTVNGIRQVDRDELVSGLASARGQPFSEVNLAGDRSQTLTYYYERGFPAADFKAEWTPAGTPHRANVVYTITEGERRFVRGVVTTGLSTTRQRLVNRRITLHAGDPLSPVEQAEIQRRFYDLGIFARVDTAIENPDGETDHKYVLYNFEEANRYTVALGAGAQLGRFGTPNTADLSSAGGATGFSPQVSFDVSRLNFLGIGHTVTLRGLYSNIDKRGSLSYLAPRFQNIEGRNITFSALYENSLNVRTFASRRAEASIQISQRLSKPTTALLRYAYRRVSVSSVVIPVLLIPQLLAPARIGMVSANLAQDRRDNPSDPHRGIYNTVDVGLAGRFFGSQRGFGRVLGRNATYHKVRRNTTLARQTQLGLITPFSAPNGLTEQQSVPLPERFFGGGADSLRAFPFNQAGPRDIGAPVVPGGPASSPTGFPLGGNALLFNNVELRFPFIGENIQGVLFHDMGNVFSTLSKISFRFKQRNLEDFDYMAHAVGFGIRYRTPIGPIRGDLAYSINPPAFIGFKGTPEQLLQCNPNAPVAIGVCQGVRQSVSHFQFFFSIGQTF